MKSQNLSHAVMSQRHEPLDSADDFPTPPWATRALFEHVLKPHKISYEGMTCLEPACGAGHMARTLKEYFREVQASDAFDYGYGKIQDFLAEDFTPRGVDWVITNPPFRLAEEFVLKALEIARVGVAILARTVFLEGVRRHEKIFMRQPPTMLAQFAERVPMVKSRLDAGATTATCYAWFVWLAPLAHARFARVHSLADPFLTWIPPCRRSLERPEDYLHKAVATNRDGFTSK